jgi:hypothetical protein
MIENYFLEMGSNCPISTNGAVQITQERVRKAQDRQEKSRFLASFQQSARIFFAESARAPTTCPRPQQLPPIRTSQYFFYF